MEAGFNISSYASFNDTKEVTTKLALSSSCASIVGGLLIIYTYVNIPNLRQSIPRKFLVYITLADLVISFGYVIGSIRTTDFFDDGGKFPLWLQSDNLCQVQSFCTTYASIASFLWTDILAFYLFYVVFFEGATDLSRGTTVVVHLFGWVLPGK